MPISALEGVSGLRDPSTEKSQTGERLTAYLDDARGDLSGNTVRAMRADLERFTAWCAERGLCSLPAHAATVVAYIEAMASVRAPATVRRYVSSVAAVHRAAGEQSPLEDVTVRRSLKRIHRHRGCRQTQVQGLTWALRRRLLAAAGDRVIDVRNRAILAVAYDAMLRRSELVALQVVDVTIERGGSASLLMMSVALEMLEGRPGGFFLMVESEGTDTEAHRNAGREILVREMLAFDDAVRLALDFRRRSPQTLVVVTADHETGGIGLPTAERRADSLKYTTEGHSAAFVPLFAVGPGAERFGGLKENREVGQLLLEAVRR